ncbi:MAG: hypothetical protein ACFCVF_02395 [Kineosporiaceae bacterium]
MSGDEAVRAAYRSHAAARPRSRALHERARGALAGGNTRSMLDMEHVDALVSATRWSDRLSAAGRG